MRFYKDCKAISVHPYSDWVLICFGIGGHHSSEEEKIKILITLTNLELVCIGGSLESDCEESSLFKCEVLV